MTWSVRCIKKTPNHLNMDDILIKVPFGVLAVHQPSQILILCEHLPERLNKLNKHFDELVSCILILIP